MKCIISLGILIPVLALAQQTTVETSPYEVIPSPPQPPPQPLQPPYQEGWPQSTGDWIHSDIVFCDIDEDGTMEVLSGSMDMSMYIWKHNGNLFTGWPQSTIWCCWSPGCADIDNDLDLDTYVACDNSSGSLAPNIHFWNYQGQPMSGWPVVFPGAGAYG